MELPQSLVPCRGSSGHEALREPGPEPAPGVSSGRWRWLLGVISEPELIGWNECPIGRLSFLSRDERERVTREERDGTLKGGNGDRARA